jgi:Fur family zinc uptake transcriptional regulator
MITRCAHDHGDGQGLHGQDLAVQLEAAERLCGERDQRLTAPRRRVLELLLEAGQPVKAYDLMAAYEPASPAKPPTVYRALEFLERQGFVHRIDSLNAFVACVHADEGGDHGRAAAFLICDCCGATREIQAEVGGAVSAAAGAAGYAIASLSVEAHGLCPDCRSV